jgi:capsular polysaccharide biosynthesis protein
MKIESTSYPGQKDSISEIYFFKRKSPRRIIKDGSLIRLARRNGYSVVNPANLSLADQIGIFKNAKVIIGYPGANWANVIFAHQNLVVYNIVDKKNSPGSLHHLLASGFNCRLIDVCFKENVIENSIRISYSDLDRKGFTIKSQDARFLVGLISRDFNN